MMRRPTFDLAGGRRVLEKLHQLVLEYDFALPGGKVLADSKSVRVGYCDRELSAALGARPDRHGGVAFVAA